MRIYREIALGDFEFWSGAVSVAKRLTENEFEMVEQYLEETGAEFSETDINDFFWFETETILDIIDVDEDDFWKRGHEAE